jgi:hypothetical protein
MACIQANVQLKIYSCFILQFYTLLIRALYCLLGENTMKVHTHEITEFLTFPSDNRNVIISGKLRSVQNVRQGTKARKQGILRNIDFSYTHFQG